MKMRHLAPVALSLALAGGALCGCASQAPDELPETGAAVEQQDAVDAEQADGTEGEGEPEKIEAEPAAPVHEHTWVSEYQLQTIPAVTETVHHDAETEVVMEDHTVCNVCFEVIDGVIEQHQAETGHVGVSTNVPVPVEKVTVEAWDETVVKTPEQTKLVSNSEKCSTCGEVQQLAQTKTIDPADAAQAVAESSDETEAAN